MSKTSFRLTLRRPRYADVMATLAMILALAGTSYAAGLTANSVASRQIKNDAVRSVDIKDGDLLALDFAAGQLPAGPAGAPGQPGQPGAVGPTYGHTRTTGLPGFASAEITMANENVTLPTGGPAFVVALSNSASVTCTDDAVATLGVIIDGVPVPGSTRDATSGVAAPFYVSGVSATLTSGAHSVAIGASCLGSSTPTGMTVLQPSVSLVLLGAS